MAKVSVIIPYFNAARFLRPCVESVLRQTLADLEVWAVDDGSTDEGPAMLEALAQKDSRLHLLRQPHQNGGAARNLGLAHAGGEYLFFLDADDELMPDMLAKTTALGDETGADLVLMDAQCFEDGTGRLLDRHYLYTWQLPAGVCCASREEIGGKVFSLCTPAPWVRLFRRALVERYGVRFMSLTNTNDLYFVRMCDTLAEKIAWTDEKLVRYRTGHANTTAAVAKDPGCLFAALRQLRESLISLGEWERMEQPWVTHVLRSAVNQLDNPDLSDASLLATYRELRRLCDDCPELLGHEEGWYRKPEDLRRVRSLLEVAGPLREKMEKQRAAAGGETVVQQAQIASPLVSVLIPVYNVRDFLPACLDSVLGQSLRQIEAVCIDDGSTDGSEAILADYAKRDDRVTLLREENSGLGTARNALIRAARGKYFVLLDSDDLLRPDALEMLFARAEADSLDQLVFNTEAFTDPEAGAHAGAVDYNAYYRRTGSYDGVMTGPKLFAAMRSRHEYLHSACLHFVRRAWYMGQGIAFRPAVLHEDIAWAFTVSLRAVRAGYCPEKLHLRRVRDASIVTARPGFRNVYGYFMACMDIAAALHGLPLQPEEYRLALDVLRSMAEQGRLIWQELPPEEQDAWQAMPERALIRQQLIVPQNTKAALEEARRQVQQLTAEQAGLRERVKALDTEKAERWQQLQQLEAEKADRWQRIQQLEAEKAELRQRIQQLETEKAERWQRIQQLETEKTERWQRIQQLSREKADLQTRVKALTDEKAERWQRIQQLSREKAELQARVKALTDEKAERWQQLQQLSREKTELTQRAEQLLGEKAALTRQTEELAGEKAALTRQTEELTAAHEADQRTIEALRAELDALRSRTRLQVLRSAFEKKP